MKSRITYLGMVGVVLVVAQQLALFVSGQDCLTAANEIATPFQFVKNFPRLPSGTQAIITSYKFGCCGNITAWQTYVQPGGGKHQEAYNITFQVWRPSPTVQQNGCYSMVGENLFTNISLGGDGLVSVTPEVSDILTVQHEDVVGYYTLSRDPQDKKGNGILLDVRRSFDRIWYHTGTVNNNRQPDCPLPVGTETDRSLAFFTNAGPVLQVSVSSFMCRPSSSITLFFSSSLHAGTISQSPLTPTSLPPGTSEATVVSSLSTDMSKQSASPTSVMSQTMAIVTSVGPTVHNNDSLGGIFAAVVVVLILAVSVLVVLLVVLLLWRRKSSQKNIKLDVSVNSINLSNPNYDYSVLLQNKSLSNREQQSSLVNPSYEIPIVTLGGPDTASTLYEDVAPDEYTYPKAVPTNYTGSSTTTYAYIPDYPGKGVTEKSAETTFSSDKDALYEAVDPDVRRRTTAGTRSGSTPPPPYPLPVPTGSGTGQECFHHMLKDALEDPSLQYEDPTLPEFREHDPVKQKGMLELPGYYVPTEEERTEHGLQDESIQEMYNTLNFFVEDQIYWPPAGTTSGIYGQLASKRYREIQRDQIRILEQIGSGQFGDVCKAQWTAEENTLELAVKTLKPGASEADKVKFLQEAAIMGQFSHSNVIRMYGVVTLGEPVLICLEILVNGDLRSYLQGLELSGHKHRDFMEAQIMFLKFAKDIAAGMDYLSQKSFVHRDLAARNILLNKSLTCKIADFGMARDLMDEAYYQSSGGKIPVKWTAPEALLYKKYSADSDVWSYGMVLFEIWSVAKKPFSTLSNSQVLRLIEKGFCQAPPPGCPRGVYELMVDCWNPDRRSRPSFSKICSNYFQQSSAKILFWDPEVETLSSAVGVCGAPLEEATKLYLDLQEKYKDYDDII